MFGGSYVGVTQMLAAIAKPPHLVAIFPYQPVVEVSICRAAEPVRELPDAG